MAKSWDMAIPERTALCDEFGTNVSESVYHDYYRPMFAHLDSLADDKTTAQSKLYGEVAKDVSDETKKKRLKCVLRYDPTLIEVIADAPPTANTFVTYCANRLGLERSEIDGGTLNDIQQECVDASDEMRSRHLDYHIERLREKAERSADLDIPDEGRISVAAYRRATRELTELVGKELPDTLQSFNQRMIGIAGRANELIAIETLLAAELERTVAFEDVAAGEVEEDIRVNTMAESGEPLHVEVKSTGVRERSDAGASRIDDPTAMFGFFDDASEVKGRAQAIAKHAAITYLPPTTLAEIRNIDGDVYELRNDSGGLFFRANNVFPDDMKQYHRTGAFPSGTSATNGTISSDYSGERSTTMFSSAINSPVRPGTFSGAFDHGSVFVGISRGSVTSWP